MSLEMAANVLQTLQNKAKIYWDCWKQATDVCSSHRWINGKSQIAWEDITQEQYVALLLFILSEDDKQGHGWPAYNAWRAPQPHEGDNWNRIQDAVSDLVTNAGQSRVAIRGMDDKPIYPNSAIENNVNVYRFMSGTGLPTNLPFVEWDEAGGRYQWYYTP